MASASPSSSSATSSTPSTPASSDDRDRRKRSPKHLRSFIAGGIAGSVAKTSVAPLDRVKILFQASAPEFQKYAGTTGGVLKACKVIWQDTGIRGLYQGHSATLLRIFPYAGIKFMVYESARGALMPTKASETPMRHFAAGAVAGVTSIFFTYPLELIRVRLAIETHAAGSRQSGTVLYHTVKRIYTEGERSSRSPLTSSSVASSSSSISPSAATATATARPLSRSMPLAALSQSAFAELPILKFYRGFTVSVVGMVPYAGTSFLVFNTLRTHFPPPPASSTTRTRTRTVLDLTYGAIAGMTSQTVSYPFEVVRRRMQIGGLLTPGRLVGFWETVGMIQKERGWRGFFVGLTIGYVKVIPMNGVSFATYMAIKDVFGL